VTTTYSSSHGSPNPAGAVADKNGVNFSIFSRHATYVELLLFEKADSPEPFQVFPLKPEINRLFYSWYIYVEGLSANVWYTWRMDGPNNTIESGLRFDKDMARVVADYKTPVVLMHMKGTPRDMQINPHYENVLQEVYDFLADRIDYALSQGINEGQIAVDPGIGFGKRLEDNLCLIKHLSFFKTLGKPLLVGPSRKSFIGQVLNIEIPAQRDIGTLGVVALATFLGIDIIRVHAVKEAKQVIKIVKAIMNAN